jgi:hypothetical protein
VLIRVANPSSIQGLVDFLASRGCIAERTGELELDVFCLSSTRHDQAAMELDLYLQLWNALHPENAAELVAD